MTLDLKKFENLRGIAMKATPGPWDIHAGTIVRAVKGDFAVPIFRSEAPVDWHKKKNLTHKVMCDAYASEVNNATYIAAANPATIIALLTRIEALEKVLKPFADKFEQLEKGYGDDWKAIREAYVLVVDLRRAAAAMKGDE